MSYLYPKGPNSRFKIYKVAVSTPEDKVLQNTSDFNYEVTLKNAITDVVGISLVEWSFPNDIIPSFYPTTTNLTGNNMLDFSLFNPDIWPVAENFQVRFPTKFFKYQNPGDPASDYTVALAQLMNTAIDANPNWTGKVRITVPPQALQGTLLIVSNTDVTLPPTTTTELKLLFASGPNTAVNSAEAMGFLVQDYTSSSNIIYLNNGSQVIESPRPVNLRAANYIDVFVEESNLKPLQRIFVDDDNYTTNIFSTEGVNRLSIDTDNPPRRLDKLHISLRYEGEGDPGNFLTTPILVPHALTFHIISLVDENQRNPSYVKQSLTY